jgi:hypothetical protein
MARQAHSKRRILVLTYQSIKILFKQMRFFNKTDDLLPRQNGSRNVQRLPKQLVEAGSSGFGTKPFVLFASQMRRMRHEKPLRATARRHSATRGRHPRHTQGLRRTSEPSATSKLPRQLSGLTQQLILHVELSPRGRAIRQRCLKSRGI